MEGCSRQRGSYPHLLQRHLGRSAGEQGLDDLLDRIASDDAFGISRAELEQAMDPKRFVGRAPQQVDEFLEEIVEPLLAGASTDAVLEEMRV